MLTYALLLPGWASAEERVFRLDPRASQLRLELAATLHKIRGSLPLSEGEIRYPAGGGPARGRFVIDSVHVITGNDTRDRRMHDEVLLSSRFPRIVYRPLRVELGEEIEGARSVRVSGELEMLGRTRPLEISARLTRAGQNGRVEGRVVVPYVDWGLKDVSTFLLRVGREVEIRFEATGTFR